MDMGRMHARSKGKSHSTRPPSEQAPSWVTYSPDELVDLIVKMAKSGLSSSVIGVKLRDEYGIPLIKLILGKSVQKVMEEQGVAPEIPEDLGNLLKRARKLQEHLSRHRGDGKNVRSLELLEAKIHRLSKHYKSEGSLPLDWKYTAKVAQLA